MKVNSKYRLTNPWIPLLITGICINMYGQNIYLSQISTKQGLPGSNIREIYQDNTGYLWFGIEAVGLCKFDGKEYRVFDNNPKDSHSLSNNFIWDIASTGRDLWIATENGLNYFYRDKNIFYQFYAETFNLTDNWANCLLFDNRENLWVGTNNGLSKINSSEIKNLKNCIESGLEVNRNNFKIQKLFYNDSITDIYGKIRILHLLQDSELNIWISTDAGVFILNTTNYSIKHLKHQIEETDGLPDNYVHFVNEYKEGQFLIGTDRGLCMYLTSEDKFVNKIYPEIRDLKLEYKGYLCYLKDSEGLEWLGMSEGLMVIDHKAKKQNKFTYIPEGKNGLESKIIRDIIEDKSGQIWISTKFGGLHVFKKHQDIFQTYRIDNVINKTNRTEDSFVLSLLADKNDNIWVGTKYGGLLKFDYNTNTFESYWIDLELENPANSNRIEYLYEDSQGDIWIGTLKGLNKLNRKSKKFTLYPFHQIRTIMEDSQGTMWIGTQHGIHIFNRKTKTFDTFSNPKNFTFFNDSSLTIYTLFEDSHNNLWFGTYENGIFVYLRDKNEVKHYYSTPGNNHGLSGNMIRSVYEDNEGTIWIGTKHSGLNYFISGKDQFEHLTKSDGLPSNTIYNILSDNKGRLWIGTHNGLSMYDMNKNTFQNFDEGHGLQSNIFENDAIAKTSTGYLLFGGCMGFNMFHPDSIKIKNTYSPLVINFLKVNDDIILIDQDKDTCISLKHFQNYIDIEFALLDFRNPARNSYRYMLDGVDKNWIEAGSRNYVSYTDLNSGDYIFRLEGIGMDNTQNIETINIPITISPPYWKTNIAIVIYIILTLLLLIGIYKVATIRANYNHRLNESKKAIQQNMEINEAKLRFFTNISHELQSPLALISAPLEKLAKSDSLNNDEKKFVDLIQKNTYRLTRLIQQLMYFRKTQNEVTKLKAMKGDIISFLKEITQPFMVFAQKHLIKFRLSYTEGIIEMWFDPDKIEKIINNLLMNAFKFTPQGGEVEIHVSTSEYNLLGNNTKVKRKKGVEQVVNISVRDTGKGMSKNEMKNIFNRFYMGKNNGEYKGTGIGLELTKTLIEMHGGTITVDSKEGEGSIFTISLFKDDQHLKKSNISEEEIIIDKYVSEFDYGQLLTESFEDTEQKSVNQKLLDKPLLLIVEDNNDLRKFLGENLSEYYNVLLARNGKEGLEIATKKIPDLIISDVMMPEMDGIDMCEKLKSDILTSHIPIILLTRKTLIEDKITGLKTGADDYVEKPFNMQYLLLRINNLFKSIQNVKEQILKELDAGKIESKGISVYDKKLLNKCKEAITDNLSDAEFSVVELGKIVGMSRSQLYRKITALTGQSPAEFIYANRLQEAKKYLVEEKYTIMDVAHLTGFRSSNSFSQVFKKNFGMSPKEYVERFSA